MNARVLGLVAVLVLVGAGAIMAEDAAIQNRFDLTVGAVVAEPFVRTDGMERVTPLLVLMVEADPQPIRVYCIGEQISWKCARRLATMNLTDLGGRIETDLRLVDASGQPYVVPVALVVDSVRKHPVL